MNNNAYQNELEKDPNMIRHLRLVAGFHKRTTFAKAVGVTPAMITLYEKGRAKPRSDVLIRMGIVCNCNPSDFYPDNPMLTWKDKVKIANESVGIKQTELPKTDLEQEIKNF